MLRGGLLKGLQGTLAVAPPHSRIASRVAFAVILASVTVLTGCGRNGALQPPPGASVETGDNQDGDAAKNGDTAKKAGSGRPDRPFVLDPII